MTSDEAKAVSRATKLMPSEDCADPAPVVEVGDGLADVEDMAIVRTCRKLSRHTKVAVKGGKVGGWAGGRGYLKLNLET
ncbi:hypothetical protein B7463_g1892, partial [Scytalidium lignicola]